ncbi:MAG TPA: efflux RND transporter permease subunit [Bacillota bacterium]|nr:efflux RND transporter permease subunit [Bacillota bacterium]
MNLTKLAIKRPAMMSMVIMVFVVLGMYTYNKIGVELFPSMNIPYITVMTSFPGAGAEEIETQLVKPMEASLSGVARLKNMTSIASEGTALTLLEFDLSADANEAKSEVQKKIDLIKGSLPDEASDPIVIKRDMNDTPVMILAVQSTRPVNETYTLTKDVIKERLLKVSGVSDITLVGGQAKEVHINVNAEKLKGYGMSLTQITNRLKAENLNQPSGRLDHPEAEYNLRVLGEFRSIEDIKNLEIPLNDGSLVALKDVADISMDYPQVREVNRVNRQASIGLMVFKQSDASVVDVADNLVKAVQELQPQLPKDTQLIISRNFGEYIRASLNSTVWSIVEGIITTAFALFFFLREWRSIAIVLLSIPTSVLATLMMMYFAGFSFNMMSLMGLALCIGILVDDSIVVLENIHRHLKMGKEPEDAAYDGRTEIGMAAVAITMSDVVVYAPIAFMTGMVGQFFREFGLTIVFATLFSLFVSFTLTPMAASRWYKKEGSTPVKEKRSLLGFLWRRLDGIGAKTLVFYDKTLAWSLDNRKKVLLFAAVAFLGSFLVFPLGLVGGEFTPKADQNELSVSLEMPIGTPIGETDKVLQIMEDYIGTIKEVKYMHTTLGSSGGMMGSSSGSHVGRIGVSLYPKAERDRSVWDVGDQIRAWSKNFPKGRVKVSESDSMAGGGSDINIEVSGSNPEGLVDVANQVKQVVAAIPGAKEVDTDWRLGQPEIQFNINRSRAALMGLSVSDVARTIRASVNGEKAGTFKEGDNDLSIVVRVAGADKISMADLGNLSIANQAGVAVPISQVASIEKSSGPTTIKRINRSRTVTITGSLSGKSLSAFTAEAQKKVAEMNLPLSYRVNFAGQAQAMADTGKDMAAAFILSIALVYMVLVMLYNSFLTPFIRMMSLPLGIMGALIALALSHNSLNMMSAIGIIMLDGLVAKNGTLLLDYTNTLRERGMDLREALMEAGRTRLRPIVMTTVTMVFGMMPTALALAEGAEVRSGMAWVLIGGLLTSTVFTLIIIPVVCIIMEGWKTSLSRRLFHRNTAA